MAKYVRGQTGNPHGRMDTNKPFTEALKVALGRTDAEGKKLLYKLADKLVRAAIEDGQGWAFQQIVDRLEGKAKEHIEIKKDYRDLAEYTDAELTALLRDRVQLVPISAAPRPDGETLN
jgi:hypothetical protein